MAGGAERRLVATGACLYAGPRLQPLGYPHNLYKDALSTAMTGLFSRGT